METQVWIPFSPNDPLTTTANMSDPKERFYRHFQTEITAIQDQIEDLGTLSSVGGERQDCVDTILAGISRLSNEVTDALDYVPAYDQRAYAQALKALTEKLNEATSKFAPKSRFQFKPRAAKSTNTTTLSASETVQQPQHDPRRLFHEASPDNNEPAADGTDSAAEGRDGLGVMPGLRRNYNEEIARPELKAGVRKPSFSSAKNIAIYDQTGLHIMLPSSASHATSSGSLTNLDECIVDMTVPTSGSMGAPFAGLAIKDVKKSLLVCGTVAGPVHITGVKDSVVVVAARQVRVHECERVDVYLHCRSHPIIEDCKGMQFAPLPECYMNNLDAANNQWDQVDDFKWLKTEPSPNWSLMSEEKRIPRELWEKTLSNPTLCASNILKKASVV